MSSSTTTTTRTACPTWCISPGEHATPRADGDPVEHSHPAFWQAGRPYVEGGRPSWYVEGYALTDAAGVVVGAWVDVQTSEVLTPADALGFASAVRLAATVARRVQVEGARS